MKPYKAKPSLWSKVEDSLRIAHITTCYIIWVIGEKVYNIINRDKEKRETERIMEEMEKEEAMEHYHRREI